MPAPTISIDLEQDSQEKLKPYQGEEDFQHDDDEWVTVSASSTISTSSTLPQHLVLKPHNTNRSPVLNPRDSLLAQIETRPKLRPTTTTHATRPLGYSLPSTECTWNTNSPTPTVALPLRVINPLIKPLLSDIRSGTNLNLKPISRSVHCHLSRPTIAGRVLNPIDTLKTHIPTLKAIYVVEKPKISRFSTLAPGGNSNANSIPFRTFTALPNPPVALNIGNANESYIQLCARCAKPKLTLYCDGTWKKEAVGPCSEHKSSISLATRKVKGCACGGRCCVASFVGKPQVDLKGADEMEKDRKLFEVVLQTLQPLMRKVCEEKGVKVFDMTVSCTEELYVHKAGCGCQNDC